MQSKSCVSWSTVALVSLLAAILVAMFPGYAMAREDSQARITVLYDAFGKPSAMKKDWGFSVFIEYGGKRILFDTGNNADVFAHNVKVKGIDLTRLDFVVVSHRHGDHVAGLNHLLKVNKKVKIYTPKENFGVFGAQLPGTFYRRNESLPAEMRYFDGNPPRTMHFGTPWPEGNFARVTESMEVLPGFHLILLKGPWGVDLDVMEISLAIETPEGVVLVVGCSHPTIEKIVATASQTLNKPIHLVVGGTHLLPAKDDAIREVARSLRDRWQVAWIAPVHCTGEPAFAILSEAFGSRYLYAGLGTTLLLGRNVRTAAASGQTATQVMDETDLRSYRAFLERHYFVSERMHGEHEPHANAHLPHLFR
ncbi:MAG: MBL fold metallo-hydrolase [Betaproteobacteria bacterium]|nr:MAG: MBL fold metallo-hydrolase [Betaproteobacteria bacterium]